MIFRVSVSEETSISRESKNRPTDGFLTHCLNYTSPHTQFFPNGFALEIEMKIRIEQIRRLFITGMSPPYYPSVTA